MYSADLRKDYQLDDDSWKYDIMPEIFNGKNVADFIDPEIDERLAELEREEDDELEDAWAAEKAEADMEAEPDMDDEERGAAGPGSRGRRKELVDAPHRRKKSAGNNAPTLPRTVSASHADPAKRATTRRMKRASRRWAWTRARRRARGRRRRSRGAPAEALAERRRTRTRRWARGEDGVPRKHSSKSRSVSVARRVDAPTAPGRGPARRRRAHARAQKMADKAQRRMNKRAKIGEADRTIITKMPKHLFSGKRGIGKTDRR